MDAEKWIRLANAQKALVYEAEAFLWRHPATGFREWEASEYLAQRYEALGYAPRCAGDIPGFCADIDTGRPGPKVLLMAELDALLVPDHPAADPRTGAAHACGHHAQGAALLGVAAALKTPGALDGLCGSIRLCAVPAEELNELAYREELKRKGVIKYFGGKMEFLRRGYFQGADMAAMIHTGWGKHTFLFKKRAIGCNLKHVTFYGKAAPAGSPFQGINALYAANLSLNAINALRETFSTADEVRVHPVLTTSEAAVNVVPMCVDMENQVRAASLEAIARVNRGVNRAVAASAAAMGAQAHLYDHPGYLPANYDSTLAEIAAKAFAQVVGEENIQWTDGGLGGCTDVGDVSALMPVIQPFGCGMNGMSHSKTLYIEDVDCACMDAARAQLALLGALLENGAGEARRVIANKKVLFHSVGEYMAAIDQFETDADAVAYEGEHAVRLRF